MDTAPYERCDDCFPVGSGNRGSLSPGTYGGAWSYDGAMDDVVVRAGPGIPNGLVIPDAELEERFSHSSGPGGQHVNTTDSRVQLRFDVGTSPSLTPSQRRRATTQLATRLVGGVLEVDASSERSQYANRRAARQRLAELLRDALAPPPPPRRATKATRGSQRRRLAAKKRRSELKRTRGRPSPHD